MSWFDEPDHPFAGIAEKLKRSHESIFNLDGEITAFFNNSKYPSIPDSNSKEWNEAVEYHKNLFIPLRFSVLCGEIVHHWRSSLDHIAWHFSSAEYRTIRENKIQFPVLQKPPTKDEISRYKGNIKGITNPNVLKLIDEIQPYHRGDDAVDDPVCIVHDLDRFDTHRELVVTNTCSSMFFPPGTAKAGINAIMKYREGESLSPAERTAAIAAMKSDPKVFPQIAFAKFGKGKTQPIVPALTQLKEHMAGIAGLFAKEI